MKRTGQRVISPWRVALPTLVAVLVWVLVGEEPVEHDVRARFDATRAQHNYERLLAAQLFGRSADEPASPGSGPQALPMTGANLSLSGIVFDAEGTMGQAIIQTSSGEESVYGIGQVIDGADGATLHEVERRYVVLERAGRLEKLLLQRLNDELSFSGAPAGNEVEGALLRHFDGAHQSRAANALRTTPAAEGADVVGLIVNPGRDRTAFAALGLVPGDVITALDGVELDSAEALVDFLDCMQCVEDRRMTLIRAGEVKTLSAPARGLSIEVDGP